MRKIVLLAIAALAAVCLAACGSADQGSTGASGASGATASGASSSASSGASAEPSAATSSASSGASSIEAVGAEDVVSISLDYNAGTGYEWTHSVSPEGVVSFVGGATEDLAEGEDITGGPLRDTFTFRAAQPGEAVITFNLVRGWESDEAPAETQVYAFTVDDDLKMVLNPYKSNFSNEPVWGSNS